MGDGVGNRLEIPRPGAPLHGRSNCVSRRDRSTMIGMPLIGEAGNHARPSPPALPGEAMIVVARLLKAKPLVSFETIDHDGVAKLSTFEVADTDY